jgi:hypothetical protein
MALLKQKPAAVSQIEAVKPPAHFEALKAARAQRKKLALDCNEAEKNLEALQIKAREKKDVRELAKHYLDSGDLPGPGEDLRSKLAEAESTLLIRREALRQLDERINDLKRTIRNELETAILPVRLGFLRRRLAAIHEMLKIDAEERSYLGKISGPYGIDLSPPAVFEPLRGGVDDYNGPLALFLAESWREHPALVQDAPLVQAFMQRHGMIVPPGAPVPVVDPKAAEKAKQAYLERRRAEAARETKPAGV